MNDFYKIENVNNKKISKINNVINEIVSKYNIKKFNVTLVFYELINNALSYGEPEINIIFKLYDNYFLFRINDNGQGFDYKKYFNYDKHIIKEKSIDESGRGIYLAKNFSDKLIYNRLGNSVLALFYEK
ncbi:MAG: ATP-binding protein [Bacillota bacterium]